jgi:hypothetical protein
VQAKLCGRCVLTIRLSDGPTVGSEQLLLTFTRVIKSARVVHAMSESMLYKSDFLLHVTTD